MAPDPRGDGNDFRPESFYGPNIVATELRIRAGYLTTVCDPVFALRADRTAAFSSRSPPYPRRAPFSLVFRAEPGKEDILLKIASAH